MSGFSNNFVLNAYVKAFEPAFPLTPPQLIIVEFVPHYNDIPEQTAIHHLGLMASVITPLITIGVVDLSICSDTHLCTLLSRIQSLDPHLTIDQLMICVRHALTSSYASELLPL